MKVLDLHSRQLLQLFHRPNTHNLLPAKNITQIISKVKTAFLVIKDGQSFNLANILTHSKIPAILTHSKIPASI